MKNAFRISVSAFLIPLLSGCTLFDGTDTNGNASSSTSSAMSEGWEIYDSNGISFTYPEDLLELETQNGDIVLSHDVPSRHIDPCDFRGDAPELQTLTDFHVRIEQSDLSLVDAVSERMSWIEDDRDLYVDGDELVLSEGFIMNADFEHLEGYEILRGVEGCGEHVYFLENADGDVVIVTRKLITELSNAVTNSDDYMDIPGLIIPNEEEELFMEIMDTLDVQ